MVHKINCLHKPPRLVDFSLQQKEGKNEKDRYIHNHIDGTDSLHGAPGSSTWICCCDGHASSKYAKSCLGLLRAEWE
jgi:hypothetical protein